jgi:hypothetical protein
MHRFSHLQQSRPENGSRQILLAHFVWRRGDLDVAICVVLLRLPVGLSLHVISEEGKTCIMRIEGFLKDYCLVS